MQPTTNSALHIGAGLSIQHSCSRPGGSLPRRLLRGSSLPEPCVITCDNVITVPLDALDDHPVGHLDEAMRAQLDEALRYALDIVY